jgi:hypothetical protein
MRALSSWRVLLLPSLLTGCCLVARVATLVADLHVDGSRGTLFGTRRLWAHGTRPLDCAAVYDRRRTARHAGVVAPGTAVASATVKIDHSYPGCVCFSQRSVECEAVTMCRAVHVGCGTAGLSSHRA